MGQSTTPAQSTAGTFGHHLADVHDEFPARVDFLLSLSRFCEERDLTYLRAQKPNFEEETARHIFSQVIRTVAAMHAQKWYHQDLKVCLLKFKSNMPNIDNDSLLFATVIVAMVRAHQVENIFVQRDKEQRFLFKIGDFGRLVTRDSEADHETGTSCGSNSRANIRVSWLRMGFGIDLFVFCFSRHT